MVVRCNGFQAPDQVLRFLHAALCLREKSEHDHFAESVVAKKQPILLKKLRTEPVLVRVAEGVALSVFWPRWGLRDGIESELGGGCPALAGVLLHIADGVFLLECTSL